MQRLVKPAIIVLSVLGIFFFSLKIENLEEHKAANLKTSFDASVYAHNFWDEQVPGLGENALDIVQLIQGLEKNPEETFEQYSHKLGISNTHYFMVKGSGKIISIEEEFLIAEISDKHTIRIATDFIFGNAVRDGSGKISINEFLNMTDFNNVSVALNKLVKEKVVKNLRERAEVGSELDFVGATELKKDAVESAQIRIIPVIATIR